MDLSLYLNVDEADPRIARVVSPTDLSRLPLPVFAYGDRLNVSVYLITRAGGYHADSTDAALGRTLTLGLRGQAAVAQTSTFTAIANGYSCTLDLDTTALALLLRAASAGTLALVHKTTGIGPNPTRRCSLDCSILGDVEVVDDGTSLSAASYYTAAQTDALFTSRTLGYTEETNAAGNTTLTPAATRPLHTAVIAFSGAGSTTRVVILATTGRVAGDRLLVLADLPQTADITVEFRNASSTGALLLSATTDTTGDDLAAEFVYTGTAWRYARRSNPA